jgi:hypothetical protein
MLGLFGYHLLIGFLKKKILVPLTSTGSTCAYAYVAATEGYAFVFDGGDGGSWYNTCILWYLNVLPYFFFWASNCIYALSVLVVECYNTRSDKWMICSGLNHEKGTIAWVSGYVIQLCALCLKHTLTKFALFPLRIKVTCTKTYNHL